jgi:hypothetical protein
MNEIINGESEKSAAKYQQNKPAAAMKIVAAIRQK